MLSFFKCFMTAVLDLARSYHLLMLSVYTTIYIIICAVDLTSHHFYFWILLIFPIKTRKKNIFFCIFSLFFSPTITIGVIFNIKILPYKNAEFLAFFSLCFTGLAEFEQVLFCLVSYQRVLL